MQREIKNIITKYQADLSDFPSGLTFQINDGSELVLTQAQLDTLDARIDGLLKIEDTSAGVAKLLDDAIPTTVKANKCSE